MTDNPPPTQAKLPRIKSGVAKPSYPPPQGGRKHVTRHWLCQQIASAALIPLSLYVLVTFFIAVVLNGGHDNATNWLHSPLNGATMMFLLGVGFYHGANGLIGIIEDYVHHRLLNRLGILAVKTGAWVLALAGIASVIKIMFGS